MGRRRDQTTLIDEALSEPWPVAAALAAVMLIGSLVLPALGGKSILARSLFPMVATFMQVLALVFALIAVAKLIAARLKADRKPTASFVQSRPPTWRPAPPPRTRVLDPRLVALQESIDQTLAADRKEPSIRPTRWSLELLRSLDWKRFEEVAAAYFRANHFRCVTQAFGPDGGIDGTLFFGDLPDPVGIFQCKAWTGQAVGVKPVRELLGVMIDQRVKRAYFLATGEYTPDAIALAAKHSIKLITGRDLLTAIAQMDAVTQAHLLALSTEGDYTTPTCASCGEKMYRKTFRTGTAWVCHGFPRCKTQIWTKAG
jgi:restriction system protein